MMRFSQDENLLLKFLQIKVYIRPMADALIPLPQQIKLLLPQLQKYY